MTFGKRDHKTYSYFYKTKAAVIRIQVQEERKNVDDRANEIEAFHLRWREGPALAALAISRGKRFETGSFPSEETSGCSMSTSLDERVLLVVCG